MGDIQASGNHSERPQGTASNTQVLWAIRQLEREIRRELALGWELPPTPAEARRDLGTLLRHRMRTMARVRQARDLLGLEHACSPHFEKWMAAEARRQMAAREARAAASEEAGRS